ncbi:MAG: alpha/beta fold hydrolase, partial [Acidobacteriota bacterium]|nr:alpha/beta fold hydrolase [Acidobacteriota bacterium]
GEFTAGGKNTFTRLNISEKDGQTIATFDAPTADIYRSAVKDLKYESTNVSFTISLKNQNFRFKGTMDKNRITGAVESDDERGRFEFIKTLSLSADLTAEYTGNYEIAPDRIITIGPFDEVGGNLTFLDLKTDRAGTLLALSNSAFFSGPTFGINYPIDISAEFSRDAQGKVTGLVWREGKEKAVQARKVFPHRQEEVTFRNNDVVLHGTLMIPEGAGKHPAVIFAHGSGAATRNVGFFQTFFIRHGIAVLSFDKRGAGKSNGDWRYSSFDDLANDVIAGIDYLKTRPDIDPKQIGVHGTSQGGWIGSIVASKVKDIAYLIVRVGPGVDVVRTVAHEDGGFMREEKLTPEQVEEGEDFARRIGYMAARGEPWEKIDALHKSVKDKPWAKHVFPAGLAKDRFWWQWYRLNGHYDSADYLKNVRVPVLWFLGEHDQNLPTPESASAIRAALAEADNRDFTVKILRRTGHGFLISDTGFNSEFPTQKYYVPGYWNVMGEWLQRHIQLPRK